MVRKSYGIRRRTRKKLKIKKGEPINVNRFLQKFNIGDNVHIDICPLTKIPHPKFQGKTGRVIGKKGNAYIIEVKDLSMKKQIISKPEHLKLQKLK